MDTAWKYVPREGLPVFIGIFLVISLSGVAAYVSSLKLQQATGAEEHTFAVVEQMDLILSTLKDAETGQRGYILTGDPVYLQPYDAAVALVAGQNTQLRRLTTNEPESVVHVERIASLSREKLLELRGSIDAVREYGQAAALTVVRTGQGRVLMDELRQEIGALRLHETQSLAAAMALTHERSRQSLRNLALWAPTTWLGMGLLALLYVRRPEAAPEVVSSSFPAGSRATGMTRGLFAAAVVGGAFAAHRWLEELVGALPPFLTFYPAVLLISVTAGSPAGILASLLSAVLAEYFFIEPRHSFFVTRAADIVGLGIFIFTCIALCILSERMRYREWAEFRRLRVLLNGVRGFAIFLMDPRGAVTTWNAAAESLEGHSEREVLGKDSAMFFTPEDIAAGMPSRTLDAARQMGEWVGEGWRCRKDGSRFWASVTVTALRDERGELIAFGQVTADSTRRKHAEDQLAATAQRYRMLVEDQSELISLAAADGTLKFVNEAYARHLGREPESLVGTRLYDHLPETELEPVRRHLAEVCRSGGPSTAQNLLVSGDAGLRWVEWTNRSIVEELTGATLIHSVGRDITDRRRADEQLRALNETLEERVRLRTADLKEKEAMLQEIHHRVKNNLQVIASLINMQIRTLEDDASRAALQECRSRVQTMALIHEKLYGSSDYANVPFADYARDLTATVFGAAGVSCGAVNLEMVMESLTMPVEQAIPCGLILNELINNAFKHAFIGASAGHLRVGLRRLDGALIELSVADNGPGIAEDFAPERSTSLGMRLVVTLVAQLHGRMEIVKNAGTTFRVIFPGKA